MPFMHGRGAIARTLQYLQQGQIILNKNIRILMFAFNEDAMGRTFPHHYGLRNFVFWHLPQLQYMNPHIQMLTINGLTPTPWVKVFCENETRLVIDCDSRSREEIHDHMKNILGKTEAMIKMEAQQASMVIDNPANFGAKFDRHCICEVPGQVPCPAWEPLPTEMTGKGRRKLWEAAKEAAATENRA